MPTGGLSPSPEQYGGSLGVLAAILTSLNRSRGTAYDTSVGSNVEAENMAIARAIESMWATNQRLANICDPLRTCLVSRWERIMNLAPATTETLPDRRAALAEVWSRNGEVPTAQRIADILADKLGAVFVALEFETVSSALTWWPGGTPNPAAPWYSTLARLAIRVTQPALMTDAEFYATVGRILLALDGRLPAWVTWNWYRFDSVTGTKGFFLDSPHNVDNDALRV